MPRIHSRRRASSAPASEHAASTASAVRRAAGLLLVVFAIVPLYRLLDHPGTGIAGAWTISQLELQAGMMLWGGLLLVPLLLIGGWLIPARVEPLFAALARRAATISDVAAACAAAIAAGLFGTLFVLMVLQGLPNNIDALAQLLHARYWASGQLAGPMDDGGGFWSMHNALFTERGWVSQYPPGHVLVLAGFVRLGVPWLAGPVLLAVTVFFGALLASRLCGGAPGRARLAALLLAASPFLVALGASYMNHVTAAAFVTFGAWALVVAWQGDRRFALLAGAGFGFALATRPLSTVAMAGALVLLAPMVAPPAARTARSFALVAGGIVAGAAPFVALLLIYNAHFFGSPFTFGYNVALGPSMSLGLHQDPWGNAYGLREAIAYTSADLLALGLSLFESPLSAVLVVGLFLLLAPRLSAGERLLAGWALAPVATNFIYWHHGSFMGPRMLYEAGPAWVILFAVALPSLLLRVPGRAEFISVKLRPALMLSAAGALAFGLGFLAPQRLHSYGGDWYRVMRTPVPDVDGPAVVFVHDTWMSRVAMTLASAGYRLDVVETILRQNSTCAAHQLARAAVGGDRAAEQRLLARIDTVPRPGAALRSVDIGPQNRVRLAPGERLQGDCAREAASDAQGTLVLEPLLWRGSPPGVDGGVTFVRDLGPERNADWLAANPGRTPWVYTSRDAESLEPVLLPYDEGMNQLWR